MAAQLPLVGAVTEFELRVGVELPSRGLEPLGFAGFGGHEIDVANNKVVIHWKGTPPPALHAILRDLESKHRVTVEVRNSPFSRAELDRAKAAVIADRANNGFVGAGHLPGASGIFLEVDRPEDQARSLPSTLSAQSALDAVRNAAVSYSPSLVVRKGAAMRMNSRANDSSPYWGGAKIILSLSGSGANGCTSGFGVRDGSWVHYMLTAAHCSNGISGWTMSDGVWTFMGPVYSANQDTDSSIATLVGGASSGTRIYAGEAPMESNRKVFGAITSTVGMSVCTSGAYSTQRCSIVVQATNDARLAVPLNYVVDPLVRADRADHQNASGQGDSGGPVFVPIGWDGSFAAGTISGGDQAVANTACTGDTSGGRLCSWRLFYPQINLSLAAHSVYLRTE